MEGVMIDPIKIEAILDWQRSTMVHEFRSFLGLTSYYKIFVEGFSKLLSPLTALTRKKTKFIWIEMCE